MWQPKKFLTRRCIAIVIVVSCLALPLLWVSAKLVKTRYSQLWIPTYMSDVFSGRYSNAGRTEHMVFLMCDHWEPGQGDRALQIADKWLANLEEVATRHTDSGGRPFQYSWFYPIDNFDDRVIERVAETARRGFGEIEVHWHHNHPGGKGFREDLAKALPRFTRVGALIAAPDATPRFAFIHGNWTLDNSGAARFCGVDDEISALLEAGCYADFTFPALGTAAQPSRINRILFARDTPAPKSYEENASEAQVGQTGTGLMMIQGPMGLDFRNPLILMEYGALDDAEGTDLSGRLSRPATAADYFKPHRVHLWNQIGSRVAGRPNVVFVKIHAHGVQHRKLIFGGELNAMLTAVANYCNEHGIKLHYVTAREAYNLVRALEQDEQAPLAELLDYSIPAPLTRQAGYRPPVEPGR